MSEAAMRQLGVPEPVEVVLGPGEVLVTMDWWHQALNLDKTVAVTGNFIDENNVAQVIERAIEAGAQSRVESILEEVSRKQPELLETLIASMGTKGTLS